MSSISFESTVGFEIVIRPGLGLHRRSAIRQPSGLVPHCVQRVLLADHQNWNLVACSNAGICEAHQDLNLPAGFNRQRF